jgi:hypothetical protein
VNKLSIELAFGCGRRNGTGLELLNQGYVKSSRNSPDLSRNASLLQPPFNGFCTVGTV